MNVLFNDRGELLSLESHGIPNTRALDVGELMDAHLVREQAARLFEAQAGQPATFLGESEIPVDPVAMPVLAGEARLENLVLGPWSVSLRTLGGDPETTPPMPEDQSVEVGGQEDARLTFTLGS